MYTSIASMLSRAEERKIPLWEVVLEDDLAERGVERAASLERMTLHWRAMEEAEQQYISAILERCGNNRTLASKQLGIGRTTLWRRYAEGEEERGI